MVLATLTQQRNVAGLLTQPESLEEKGNCEVVLVFGLVALRERCEGKISLLTIPRGRKSEGVPPHLKLTLQAAANLLGSHPGALPFLGPILGAPLRLPQSGLYGPDEPIVRSLPLQNVLV